MSKSTVHRLLSTMYSRHYVKKILIIPTPLVIK
ncbi:helix-turn-helix domain-containing protein [Acetobacterium sp.]